MTPDDTRAKPSNAVLAGLSILDAFEDGGGAMTLGELAAVTSVPKASALRHLKALVQTGYVIHDQRRKTYALGPSILVLANRFIAQHPLVHGCRGVLDDIARETGETAHYAVLQGVEVIYLDIAESPHRVRAYVSRGDRLPAHCTASGKAMLAYNPLAAARILSGGPVERLTARTITGTRELRDELETTRERGYGINLSEWMDDVAAAAAPVFAAAGDVVAAVGVAGPVSRVDSTTIDDVGMIVRRHADRLSATLRGRAA